VSVTRPTLPKLCLPALSRKAVENATVTAAFLSGLLLIAAAVALVSLPAGLAVLGLELVAVSVLHATRNP
jgi:hypothetical protein